MHGPVGISFPQLRMVHQVWPFPPCPNLPNGFQLSEAEPGDGAGIAHVLSEAFGEPWDDERVERELLQDPDVPKTFVIKHELRIVATASYQRKDEEFPISGWVHWVGVDPSYSGRGLGYLVVWAVVKEARDRQDNDLLLLTDDHRLAAIKTYAKLGFKPDICHVSHRSRWESVMKSLGINLPFSLGMTICTDPYVEEPAT